MNPGRHLLRAAWFLTLLAEAAVAAVPANAAEPANGGRFQSFMIGNLKATSLFDGAMQAPNDGMSFVVGRTPAEVAAVLKAAGAPTDHFDLSIEPLLVRTAGELILFDTGCGSYCGGDTGKLPESMAAAGIKPASVTDIFISHVHGDHVGGLLDSKGAPAFPNATIHMSAAEWDWLKNMPAEDGEKIGIPQVKALVGAIRFKVVPFSPGENILPGAVQAVLLAGHTPGHSGFRIGSGASSLLFVGDAMHSYIVSVRKPDWQVDYDTYRDVGAATRVSMEQSWMATGQRLYVEHFPFPGVGHIKKEKDGATWAPDKLN